MDKNERLLARRTAITEAHTANPEDHKEDLGGMRAMEKKIESAISRLGDPEKPETVKSVAEGLGLPPLKLHFWAFRDSIPGEYGKGSNEHTKRKFDTFLAKKIRPMFATFERRKDHSAREAQKYEGAKPYSEKLEEARRLLDREYNLKEAASVTGLSYDNLQDWLFHGQVPEPYRGGKRPRPISASHPDLHTLRVLSRRGLVDKYGTYIFDTPDREYARWFKGVIERLTGEGIPLSRRRDWETKRAVERIKTSHTGIVDRILGHKGYKDSAFHPDELTTEQEDRLLAALIDDRANFQSNVMVQAHADDRPLMESVQAMLAKRGIAATLNSKAQKATLVLSGKDLKSVAKAVRDIPGHPDRRGKLAKTVASQPRLYTRDDYFGFRKYAALPENEDLLPRELAGRWGISETTARLWLDPRFDKMPEDVGKKYQKVVVAKHNKENPEDLVALRSPEAGRVTEKAWLKEQTRRADLEAELLKPGRAVDMHSGLRWLSPKGLKHEMAKNEARQEELVEEMAAKGGSKKRKDELARTKDEYHVLKEAYSRGRRSRDQCNANPYERHMFRQDLLKRLGRPPSRLMGRYDMLRDEATKLKDEVLPEIDQKLALLKAESPEEADRIRFLKAHKAELMDQISALRVLMEEEKARLNAEQKAKEEAKEKERAERAEAMRKAKEAKSKEKEKKPKKKSVDHTPLIKERVGLLEQRKAHERDIKKRVESEAAHMRNQVITETHTDMLVDVDRLSEIHKDAKSRMNYLRRQASAQNGLFTLEARHLHKHYAPLLDEAYALIGDDEYKADSKRRRILRMMKQWEKLKI